MMTPFGHVGAICLVGGVALFVLLIVIPCI